MSPMERFNSFATVVTTSPVKRSNFQILTSKPMNDSQKQFLNEAAAQAVKANHPFPQMAACEAALESTWGHSELAREANNLFGMKQHAHPVYGTMTLPTREFEKGEWIQTAANWVKYSDWRACFVDRLATLERLSNAYPHYKAAIDAKDAHTYITEVSKTWSTDPNRALKVEGIYAEYVSATPAASPGAAATPTDPAKEGNPS
jgi:flagellum-specific peptidoglycan hydrolase FlgJ